MKLNIRPEFLKKIERMGIEINGRIFDSAYKHTYVVKTNVQDSIIQNRRLSQKQSQNQDPNSITNTRRVLTSQNDRENNILRRLQNHGRNNN